MRKMNYASPELEIIRFDTEDVITSSGGVGFSVGGENASDEDF